MSPQHECATDTGSDAGIPGTASLERPAPSLPEVLAVLHELVRLKDLKDRFGETADYRASKDRAWNNARRLVG